MKNLKKYVLMLLTMTAMFIFGSISVLAASNAGYFTYTAYEDGVKITEYTGAEAKVVIPEKLGKKKVRAVGGNFIKYKSEVSSVMLPETLLVVEGEAFKNCSALENITFGSQLTTIGSGAFYGCMSLKTIDLPGKLEIIDQEAFSGTGLVEISIPARTETIGKSAFDSCRYLESVVINNGTRVLQDTICANCPRLEMLVIPRSVVTIGSDIVQNSPEVVIEVYKDSEAAYYISNYNSNTSNPIKIKYQEAVSIPATKVYFKKTTITVYEGQKVQLEVKKKPAATTDAIVWKSFDTEKVEVNNYGLITAKAAGTATIRAYAISGLNTGNIYGAVNIIVKPAPKSIYIVEKGKTEKKSSHTLYTNKKMTLVAKLPSVSKGAPYTFSSSDTKIATIDQNGLVKPKKTGVVNIIAKTYNGVVASYALEIKKYKADMKEWTERELNLEAGSMYTFKNPNKVKDVKFVSSNKSVVTVDKKGVVKAIKPGTAVITVYTSLQQAKCKVKVTPKPDPVKWSSFSLEKNVVSLKWRAQDYASGYEVYCKVKGADSYQRVKTTKGLTYKSGKLSKTVYSYKVRAYTLVGGKKVYGEWSTVKQFDNR